MSIDTEIKNTVRATDKDAQYDEKAKRLLSTLLSMELTATEKLEIIKTEYHIPVDDELRM